LKDTASAQQAVEDVVTIDAAGDGLPEEL